MTMSIVDRHGAGKGAHDMKRLIWLLPLALALSACGPLQPLGYCAADGLFYYTLGNPRNLRSATPAEVQAQGFDPYGYGSWCPGGAPTATPTDTAEPATPTPTDTAEPPTPTAISTDEPTATAEPPTAEALSPTPTATWPAPTPTSEPPERKPQVRIEKAYLLVNEIDGRWCVLLSDTAPSRQAQSWRCFPEQAEQGQPWVATGAPCAGPIYDNDVWECDDESLEWRQARWPDAPWLHGLGRDSLKVLCGRYPDYCDG